MLTTTYSDILSHEFGTITPSNKPKLSTWAFWQCIPLFSKGKSLEHRIDEITGSVYDLGKNLLIIKGVHSFLREDWETLKGANFSDLIERTNALINSHADYKSDLEDLISHNTHYRVDDLNKANSILEETIQTLYDCLRILKRVNKKTPSALSESAKIAIGMSSDTLNKVYAN